MQSEKKLKSQKYNEEESDNEKEIQNSSDDEQKFHPIEILIDHNISQNDIKKLIESGYKSIESVFYQTSKNLSKILSLLLFALLPLLNALRIHVILQLLLL